MTKTTTDTDTRESREAFIARMEQMTGLDIYVKGSEFHLFAHIDPLGGPVKIATGKGRAHVEAWCDGYLAGKARRSGE